ncbi:MAG: mandelate racemase/muconate lactonizing enzyme family protein [Parvibaculaceae bacterium]
MRITGIETFPLVYDMPYALTYARGTYQTREALLVKVHTSEPGLFGWGEAAMWGGPHPVTASVIEQEIAPLVVGEDPRRPEYLWEKVYQSTYYHGRKGILLAALSGVDIALWDIVGKAAGQPLWRIFGGFGRPLTSYASAGYYRNDYDHAAFAADVSRARAAGFRGYKMKIGNIPQTIHSGVLWEADHRCSFDDDVARVRVAREALGSGLNLMVDGNTSLSSRMAMRYAAALEPLNIRWFEEPTQPEDIEGCAELARRTRIPVAGFETESGKYQFAKLIDAGAIQVVQFDVVQVGGFTEARKIAGYAQMKHLAFTAKNYSTAISTAATLQLLYAYPNGDYFECDQDPNELRDGFIASPIFEMDDGMTIPNDKPGLGIDVDEEALKRWIVR